MDRAIQTRDIWGMRPGDTLLIDRVSANRFRKACARREEEMAYIFTIEKVDGDTSQVTCHDSFDVPHTLDVTRKRHPLHFLEEGECRCVYSKQESAWRSTARYIERNSEKRFLFTRKKSGFLEVCRLPDGADKSLYRKPKSKYGFDEMEPGETRFYGQSLKLSRKLKALRDYEERSAYGFHVEREEDGVYITRIW